jgi:hypothetical protein
MNAPAQDIKDILVDASIGLTFNTNLFVGKEPADVNVLCVTVLDSGGFDSDPNYSYERPTVQVRVRGAVGGYQAAYAKAAQVKSTLHGNTLTEKNNARYIVILCMGDILPLGFDEENRPLFTVNFRIHRTDIS